jgi:hypothetical protein
MKDTMRELVESNDDLESLTLDFKTEKLKNLGMTELLTKLSLYKNLKSLRIKAHTFSSKELAELCSTVNVEKLDLSNSENIDQQIIERICKNSSIRELTLDNCNINDECARLLANSLQFRNISLIGNKITDLALPAFAKNNTLTILNLIDNSITQQGVDIISKNSNLKIIFIKNQKLTGDPSKTCRDRIEKNIVEKQKFIMGSIIFAQANRQNHPFNNLPKEIMLKIIFLSGNHLFKHPIQIAACSYLILKNMMSHTWRETISKTERMEALVLAKDYYNTNETGINDLIEYQDNDDITIFQKR